MPQQSSHPTSGTGTGPFIWASLAALTRLRQQWGRGAAWGASAVAGEPKKLKGVREPVGRSVYLALCEIANEGRVRKAIGSSSGAFRTSLRSICERAGVSDGPVARALVELERIGLLEVARNNADGGKRAGATSSYRLLEPDQTIEPSPKVDGTTIGPSPKVQPIPKAQPTDKVRTSIGPSPDVPTDKVGTSPYIGKKGKKEEPPVSPGSKVGGEQVTDDEFCLASEIVAAFNAAADSRYQPETIDHLRPIVLRCREFPDLTADDHRGIIAAVFAGDRWWKGPPSPAVIYGNKGQFERSIETWKAAPRHLRAVESAPAAAELGRRDELAKAWSKIAVEVENVIPAWLLPVEPAGIHEGVAYFSTPSDPAWLNRRYSALVTEALAAPAALGREIRVRFIASAEAIA